MNQKRGQVWETIVPWIITVTVIVLALILILFLAGYLDSVQEFIKSLWRFGR